MMIQGYCNTSKGLPPIMPLALAALNMFTALVCGALIGSERQVRRRMAGLRTNALVALGAAGFVVFSGLYDTEMSPTRVGAQVVSGIGFLGAGIMFRHGFTIHGLNTAATLWCSAAVGVLAGSGALSYAIVLTGFIMFINVGLRPLVSWLKRTTGAGRPLRQEFRIEVVAGDKDIAKVKKAVLDRLNLPGFHIEDMSVAQPETNGDTLMLLNVAVEDRDDSLFRATVTPLMTDPRIRRLTWENSADN